MHRRPLSPPIAAALSVLLLLAAGAAANEPEFKASSAERTQQMDCPTPANQFDPISMMFLADDLIDVQDGERSIRCVTEVRNEGKGRKGVKTTLDVDILDLDGDLIQSLGTRSGRTNRPKGYKTFDFTIPDTTPDVFVVVIEGKLGTRRKIETQSIRCTALNRKPCVDSDTTLCLLDDDRFKVQVDWRSSSESGQGSVRSAGFDSGSFSFSNPDREDLLVRLLNACSSNDHFWVFADALTSIEYDLTVTDTFSGEIKQYSSPVGQPAQAITDTSAFATCP